MALRWQGVLVDRDFGAEAVCILLDDVIATARILQVGAICFSIVEVGHAVLLLLGRFAHRISLMLHDCPVDRLLGLDFLNAARCQVFVVGIALGCWGVRGVSLVIRKFLV